LGADTKTHDADKGAIANAIAIKRRGNATPNMTGLPVPFQQTLAGAEMKPPSAAICQYTPLPVNFQWTRCHGFDTLGP
jgi:hypothetical protein